MTGRLRSCSTQLSCLVDVKDEAAALVRESGDELAHVAVVRDDVVGPIAIPLPVPGVDRFFVEQRYVDTTGNLVGIDRRQRRRQLTHLPAGKYTRRAVADVDLPDR